jgi:hypothetical protein
VKQLQQGLVTIGKNNRQFFPTQLQTPFAQKRLAEYAVLQNMGGMDSP